MDDLTLTLIDRVTLIYIPQKLPTKELSKTLPLLLFRKIRSIYNRTYLLTGTDLNRNPIPWTIIGRWHTTTESADRDMVQEHLAEWLLRPLGRTIYEQYTYEINYTLRSVLEEWVTLIEDYEAGGRN